MFFDSDLHIHTTYSDGDMTPEQLVDRYISNKYSIIAITDHDGVDGSAVAISYARNKPITVLPGIELSTEDQEGNNVHMLGYSFDLENSELKEELLNIKVERAKRNDRLLRALVDMGYQISVDDLIRVNEGNYIGKPTFAKVLLEKGYVRSVSEAFDRIFARPELSRIKTVHMSCEKAISLIHRAGGLAVMAHPMELREEGQNRKEFMVYIEKVIRTLMDQGIDGIECWHPSASYLESKWLRDFARNNNLIVTGGSDFHSDNERRFRDEN